MTTVFERAGVPSCAELIALLLDYLAGALPAERQAAIDRHLALCEACTAYLATYRQAIALGRGAFAESVPPLPDDVAREIVRALTAVAEEG